MPTVFNIGPYRFFFYAGDKDEPIHVHVERDDVIAKFWLNPVRLANSGRFPRNELIKIQKMVENNKKIIEDKWDEFFYK